MCNYRWSIFFTVILLLFSKIVTAQIVEDIDIKDTANGYDLKINFFVPLRYQSHSPRKGGDTLEILMKPKNFADPDLAGRLMGRVNVSWDRGRGVPLGEIVIDGEVPDSPRIIVRFIEDVKYSVRNSADLRSLMISVDTGKSMRAARSTRSRVASFSSPNELIARLKKTDPKTALVLDRANQEMLNKNYSRAVQLFTKMRNIGSGEALIYAQELIGVARELNGQAAQAKAEYQKFLTDFPNSEAAERVRQRLTTLLTATEKPKEKLKVGRRGRAKKRDTWEKQLYGGFAQRYFRNEITQDDDNIPVVQSDLTTDMDLMARVSKGDFSAGTQFIGSYRQTWRTDDDEGEFLPNIFTVDVRNTELGIYSRVGRQSRTSGGVLGRYDGVLASIELSSNITLNGVYGFPVDTTDKTKINSDVEFYGGSVDFLNIWEGWDFNLFYISQESFGIQDREAAGGEIRYFDQDKSFFTLVDYDTYFEDLNIFLFVANMAVTDTTTVNLVLDYRKSPILTTTNAIIGQQVLDLSGLAGLFNEDQLKQLALDRTAESQSVTLSASQELSKSWQFVGDITTTEFGATPASGGVPANPGTDTEFVYSGQFVGNNIITDADSFIFGLRYSDATNFISYAPTISWRAKVSDSLRVNPRINMIYREDKDDNDNQTLVRPYFRVDYRFKKWTKFELDLGYEWIEQNQGNDMTTSQGYYVSFGYRVQY